MSSSSSITRETFFLLAPFEVLRDEHVKGVTSLKELKNSSIDDCLLPYRIGEYKPAIITETLFSFFRFTEQRAFLVLIDKRSHLNHDLRRYNFYGLLGTFGKGKTILSLSMKSNDSQERKSVNLTNVLVRGGQALVLELAQLHTDYDDGQDWWMRGIVYEIVLASYQDSNGDGIGDINGLRQRLDYIQSIGVKTIWLTPIYPSPWQDYGYDISDFCGVDIRFGTLEDFRILVQDIHSRQMRIIIDFVPNHTSYEHPWFQAALRNDPVYVDYFVWHEGKNGGIEAPTNWIGASGQPMWTFAPERNMYYLHQFLDSQPDLNFRNEKVLVEMERVLRFWLDLGVDGFRADAVRHLLENDSFRDEPRSDVEDTDPSVMYDAYEHTETGDQPGSYTMVRRWRKFLDYYASENNRDYILLITEAYNRDVRKVMNYYGMNREERGSDISINFLITYFLDKDEKAKTALELDKHTSDWVSNLPEGAWSNWCLGSHDSRRVTSRLPSKELIDGFYMLLLLQTGTALIYYGDEIGMCDRPFTLANREEIVDITAFNYGDKYVEKKVRDCQRTPMQWSSQMPYADFTSASSKPYLPLSDTWPEVNVERQKSAPRSHVKLFEQLVILRQQAPFYGGHQKKVLVIKELYAFVRWLDTSVYLIVINMNKSDQKPVSIDFAKLLQCDDRNVFGEVVARSCNMRDDSPLGKEGNKVNLNDVLLQASEAVLLQIHAPIKDIRFLSVTAE